VSKIISNKSAFPFEFEMPNDLSPSVFCNSHKVQGLQGSIRYELVAEFDKGDD
jgi:hypothetical protein